MYTRIIGRFQGLAILLLLGAPLILAGCAPGQLATTEVHCPPDCRLVITLPEDPGTPPEVSKEEFYVRAGEAVEFEVVGRPGGQPPEKVTILKFPEQAFVNHRDKLVHTIVLPVRGPGYRARSDLDCSRPDSCRFKYDVINSGNEKRPPLDPWIIIHQ